MVVSKFFPFVIFISYFLYIFSFLKFFIIVILTKLCVYKCLYLIFLYILFLFKREREKGYMETNTGVGKRNSNAFDEHAWPVIS